LKFHSYVHTRPPNKLVKDIIAFLYKTPPGSRDTIIFFLFLIDIVFENKRLHTLRLKVLFICKELDSLRFLRQIVRDKLKGEICFIVKDVMNSCDVGIKDLCETINVSNEFVINLEDKSLEKKLDLLDEEYLA